MCRSGGVGVHQNLASMINPGSRGAGGGFFGRAGEEEEEAA